MIALRVVLLLLVVVIPILLHNHFKRQLERQRDERTMEDRLSQIVRL